MSDETTQRRSLLPFGYAILLNFLFLLALVSVFGGDYSWLWIMTIPFSSYLVVAHYSKHPEFAGTPVALNVLLVSGVQVAAAFFLGIAAALFLFLMSFI